MTNCRSNIVFFALADTDTVQVVAERKRRDRQRKKTGIVADPQSYEQCSTAVALFRIRLEAGAGARELDGLAVCALRRLAMATRQDPNGVADYADVLWRLEEMLDSVAGLTLVHRKLLVPLALLFGRTGEREAGKGIAEKVAADVARTSRDNACAEEVATLLGLTEACLAVLLVGEAESDNQLIAIRETWIASQQRSALCQYLVFSAYVKIVEMRDFPVDFIRAAIERRRQLEQAAGPINDWYLAWVLDLVLGN